MTTITARDRATADALAVATAHLYEARARAEQLLALGAADGYLEAAGDELRRERDELAAMYRAAGVTVNTVN